MAEQILMLALSPTMEKGLITKWLKNVGDKVTQGEVLCEVETDKATMDYESQAEGTLLKIVVPQGGEAAIGDCIGVIGQEGEDVSEIESAPSQPAPEPEKPQTQQSQQEQQTKPQPKTEATPAQVKQDKVRSTPLARKIAQQHGIDIESLTGTGPAGRVIVRDVEQSLKGGKQAPVVSQKLPDMRKPEPLEDKEIPVTPMRKAIAQRLAQSKFSAPHYYLKVSANVDELVRTRQKLNLDSEKNISLNAFLIKLCAEAIKHHPRINSTWADDKIIRHGSIDIGLAVALEDGLITPVVRDCGNKGILAIESELTELISLAKESKLESSQYSGATFTISNLGSYGIEEFTAIINPPGSAILAVGQIAKTPVIDIDGNIKVAPVMKLTLSCDHRVIDGAVGAAFVKDLKQIIESPLSAFY